MKVLITGAAGRIGFKTAQLCVKNGYSVNAFDLPHVNWSSLEALGVESIKGDITDPVSVRKACAGVNAVIHLAALLPPRTEQNRDLTQRINVEGTRNILKSIEHGARIVFASSISTYGITAHETLPIKETHKQVSHNHYAESKIQSEQIIKAASNPYTILRIAPVSVADLLELPEIVAYRADQRVECVYADDASYALYRCLEEKENMIYNIASGKSWRMRGDEYLNRFYSSLGVEVDPNYPEEYTAVDWYDTTLSKHLGYQRINFNQFEKKLVEIGEELGLR